MNTQLIATTVVHPDINEITLLVARQVKGITAAGQRIQSTTILQSGPNWIATIVHTPAPRSHPKPRTQPTPPTNGNGAGGLYIRLIDLAERCYYSIEATRRLCATLGITLHRGDGSGRPHIVTIADAQRFAAEQCPGVRIDFSGVIYQPETDIAVAA